MLRPSQNLVNITAPVVEILAFPFVRVCGKTVCESLYWKHFCESLTGGKKFYESLYYETLWEFVVKIFSALQTLTNVQPEIASKAKAPQSQPL
jgi:hypothetical protein